jgi:phage shock protein E
MNYVIIDVREPDEFKEGHVESAINLPLGKLMRGADELVDMPKDTHLIVYCRSGGRAGMAKKALQERGFANVVNGINKVKVEMDLI